MKKIIYLLTISVALFSTKVNAQCNAPKINSFSPVTGFIGSTVTINGAYFDNTPSNNQVYFGAVQATVLTASFGTLTVQVPVGASTAPISVKNSCNLTAYSPLSFNGIFCPTPLTNTTYENTAVNLTSIYGAYNMVLQDMDLDGKPDVVTCNAGVTIARNTSTPGSLSFTANNFANGGSSVSTADFDGDGKRDLFCVARVYRNTSTGPGNIGLTQVSGIGFSGYQGATGDFNNDGKIDIVFENGSGVAYFYRNTSTGPGNISFTSSMSVNVGARCTGIQCADVDNDGLTDFIATQGNLNRAVTLRNTTTAGASTFTFEGLEAWSSGGSYPYRCQLGDFDKDGKIDLASVNYTSPATAVPVWRNTSTAGNISFATAVTFAGPNQNYRIGIGDVDGDGYPDIVTRPNGVEQKFSVYRNTSSGTGNINFASRITYTSSGSEVGAMVIGDLDGDFVPDVATSGISSNRIVVHRNTSAQQDVTNPTAACKNITVALSPSGTVTVTAAMIDNGSSDACGIGSILINGSASVTFNCNNIGANTVTLTVKDKANNQATCTATVTVAAAAIIVSGQTTVCQGQTVTLTANTGDSYQWYKNGTAISGETNQTYIATTTGNYQVEVINSGGCSGTSSVTVVTVNTNPTVGVTPSGSAPLCNGVAVLTASLSSIYQWKLNGNPISGATQQTYNATATGSYTVTVLDIFGCSATSNAVTVTNTPPEIDITGNSNSITDGDNSPSATDDTDFGTTGSHVSTFTINNSGSGDLNIYSITIGGADPGNFTVGGITLPTTVSSSGSTTFTVTFSLGTLGTRNATVNVNNNDCDEPLYDFSIKGELTCTDPLFTICPGNISVPTANGTCNAEVSYAPTITGTPDPALSYQFSGATTGNGSGSGSGSTFNKGITTVVLSATNTCGTETCSFTVTVSDNEAPQITCANDISQTADAGVCNANVNVTSPTVSDNCTQDFGASSEMVTNGSFSSSGSWNACGNIVEAQYGETAYGGTNGSNILAEIDSENTSTTSNDRMLCQNISGFTIGKKYKLTFVASRRTNGAPNPVGAFVKIDGGALNEEVIRTNTSFALTAETFIFTATQNTHQLTFTPNSQNTISYGFMVDDVSIKEIKGSLINNYNYTSDASDNYPVGTTTVTWTVKDIDGNVNTCTQIIKVTDDEAPKITCASDQSQTADAGVCKAAVTVTGPTTSDNCGVASVTNDYNNTSDASDTYPVGSTTVTWTVKDVNGNENTCTQIIKVTDDEDPVANCKNFTLNLSGGAGTISSSDVDDNSSDNCGIASMSVSPSSFTCANAGNNTVTLTITDIHGNSSTCDATVTVQYQPSCSISVTPSNNTYTGGNPRNIYLGYGPQSATMTANATGGSGFTYSWSPSTYLSNASIQNPVFTPTAEGNYTYTVTVTNSNGCKTTCSVTFCVKNVNVTGKGGSGKVYLCHVPPGNSSNPQTLSISVNAVPSHLSEHSGDALGKCGATCNNNKRTIIDELVVDIENLEITCSPNPFSQSFKLNYISSFSTEATISVYGITGNLLEQTHVSGNSNQVELGNNLPAGIYTVSFNQGKLVKVFKMIKVN